MYSRKKEERGGLKIHRGKNIEIEKRTERTKEESRRGDQFWKRGRIRIVKREDREEEEKNGYWKRGREQGKKKGSPLTEKEKEHV